jgi:type II secretory pathway component PulC
LSDIYGNKNEYEKVFEDVKKLTQTSWADIAARGTIALLTLFLVQIFFSVYKFNRQLSSSLSAKAEAIEMIASDKDSEQLLNKELISVVKQHLPGFGKEPKTPLHEAIDLAGKLKEHVQIKKT